MTALALGSDDCSKMVNEVWCCDFNCVVKKTTLSGYPSNLDTPSEFHEKIAYNLINLAVFFSRIILCITLDLLSYKLICYLLLSPP